MKKSKATQFDKKKSFILYKDQGATFDALTNKQAGQLIKAIFDQQRGKTPNLDPVLSLVFISIEETLKRDEEKWIDTRKKRKIAGSLGGKKRVENQRKASKSSKCYAQNGNKTKEKQANQAVSVSVSVSDSVLNTKKRKEITSKQNSHLSLKGSSVPNKDDTRLSPEKQDELWALLEKASAKQVAKERAR